MLINNYTDKIINFAIISSVKQRDVVLLIARQQSKKSIFRRCKQLYAYEPFCALQQWTTAYSKFYQRNDKTLQEARHNNMKKNSNKTIPMAWYKTYENNKLYFILKWVLCCFLLDLYRLIRYYYYCCSYQYQNIGVNLQFVYLEDEDHW